MAIPRLLTGDFTGPWKINSDTYQAPELQQYIDDLYDEWVQKIISVDAFNTVDDLGTLTPKWIDLFEGVKSYYNTDCDQNLKQQGVNRAMKGLLYFLYVKDNFDATNSGNVESLQEVSNRTSGGQNGAIASTRWNKAIKELRSEILPFIENYEKISVTITSSVEGPTNIYTLGVDSTLYLDDADSVTIDGVEYVASNIVGNTSFEINSSTGLDFTGEIAAYEPYKDFPLCNELYLMSGSLRPIFA